MADSKTQFQAERAYGFAGQAMPPDAHRYSETEFLALLGDRVRAMRLPSSCRTVSSVFSDVILIAITYDSYRPKSVSTHRRRLFTDTQASYC